MLKAVVTLARGAIADLLEMASGRIRPREEPREELMNQIHEDEQREGASMASVRLSDEAVKMVDTGMTPDAKDEVEIPPPRGSLAWRARYGDSR